MPSRVLIDTYSEVQQIDKVISIRCKKLAYFTALVDKMLTIHRSLKFTIAREKPYEHANECN